MSFSPKLAQRTATQGSPGGGYKDDSNDKIGITISAIIEKKLAAANTTVAANATVAATAANAATAAAAAESRVARRCSSARGRMVRGAERDGEPASVRARVRVWNVRRRERGCGVEREV